MTHRHLPSADGVLFERRHNVRCAPGKKVRHFWLSALALHLWTLGEWALDHMSGELYGQRAC